MHRSIGLAVVACVLPLCACGGGDDVIGAHVRLAADGSGNITVRSLKRQEEPGATEAAVQGVQFRERVRLTASGGRFQELSDVRIGEIQFERTQVGLRVTIPCGPDLTWPDLFAPSKEDREKAAAGFDPSGGSPRVGSRVVFQIEVPGDVVAANVAPRMSGVDADRQRRRARLSISALSARTADRTFVWDVTWR